MPTQNETIEWIPIANLRFDPENPRLPSSLNTEDLGEVLDWMLEDATIVELMAAIGERGYFPGEPVLVIPITEPADGIFGVVEGNRRLTASILLKNPELAPRKKKAVKSVSEGALHKPEELPALKFDTRNEILDYLGYRHITGIKEWGPRTKSKYLKQLYDRSEKNTIQKRLVEVAKIIGSRADYVARLLTGFALYEKIENDDFFDIEALGEQSFDFSLLTTSLSYNGIVKKHLGLNSASDIDIAGLKKSHLKELISWLFEKASNNKTRVGESRNLKLLNAVVMNDNALDYFRGGSSLQDAFLRTEGPIQLFQQSLRKAKAELLTAQSNIHLIDEPIDSDREVLDEISRMTKLLIKVLQDKAVEQEEA